MAKRVGFIGVGRIGRPMIERLCLSGYEVVAFDISESARATVRSVPNCETVSSISRVAEATEIVITMLPDGHIVEEVLFGDLSSAGLAPTLAENALVVDMSSSAPLGTIALANRLSELGIWLIDCPVSGGVIRAENGTLSIFAGGHDEQIARATPILETLGKDVFRVGSIGMGHAAKALNNLLSAACFAVTIEVLGIAKSVGLDPETFVRAVNTGSGRNNATENKIERFVLSEKYDSGFTVGLLQKDLDIALELANAVHADAPLSHHVRSVWREALEALGADADHTELGRSGQVN